jgi:hypothetical protein
MANERDRAATVIAQERDRLQVEHGGERLTVPMRGFPPGFELQAGTLVILYDEPTGTVARPLVRAVTSRLPEGAARERASVDIQGRRAEMQESTIVDDAQPRDRERPADEYIVWVTERTPATPTEQVIAVRRPR